MLLACLLALVQPALAADLAAETPSSAAPSPSQWLSGYDALRLALVADDATASTSAAHALAISAAADTELSGAAAAVASAADAAGRRAAFAELSRVVVLRLSVSGAPKMLAYHCPMFPGFAYWVQPRAGIANPYMGTAMPDCGEEVSFKAAVKAASAG